MHSVPEESAQGTRKEKGQDLWQRFGADPHNIEIRNALVEKYLPLVRTIAEQIQTKLPRSVTFDDLFSSGVFGLMDAIKKFDPDRGVTFVYYACRRIHGEILDELRKNNFVPRDISKQIKKHQKAFNHLYSIHGQTPTEEEIAKEINMSLDKYRNFVRQNPKIAFISLEARTYPKRKNAMKQKRMKDILIDEKSTDPTNGAWVQEEFWGKMFEELTIRECILLILFYREKKTMPIIGKFFGMSQPGISQIHTKILQQLKERFSNNQRDDNYLGLLREEQLHLLASPRKPSGKRPYRKRWRVRKKKSRDAAQEL